MPKKTIGLSDLFGRDEGASVQERINCDAEKSRNLSPLLKETLTQEESRVLSCGGNSGHVEGTRSDHETHQGVNMEQACLV